MLDGNSTPESPRIGRRKFIERAAKILAPIGLFSAGFNANELLHRVRPTEKPSVLQAPAASTEIPLTPEQQEKRDALHGLNELLDKYSNDKTVANFLANASQADVDKSFTLIKERPLDSPNGYDVNAWNLKIPSASGDINISYRNKENNPNERIRPFEEIRFNLDVNGKIVSVGQTLDEDEMKRAFGRFTVRPLVNDEDWVILNLEPTSASILEIANGYHSIGDGNQIFTMMLSNGLTLINILPEVAPTPVASQPHYPSKGT